MRGIASLVETLRKDPGSFGMAYGNGGWMSKHSVRVYSTSAPEDGWASCDSSKLQRVDPNLPNLNIDKKEKL
jgi:acetyl-CoA C-acetyltransferase